jgi:tRNA(Arg) A34 adenosine deaminase TadA
LAKKGTKAFDPMETDPMSCAFFEARAAMERGEVPVGAVIVRDGAIISRAGNQTLQDKDPTAHAEILAIQQACRAEASERLSGCDIYVTLEPCAMCAAAISFARLRRLYFAALDPKGGFFLATHLPSCAGYLWRDPGQRGRCHAERFFHGAAMNVFKN